MAITAALFAAPAYSAMRTPAAGKIAQMQKAVAKQPVFSKPAQAYGTNLKAPADTHYDSFLVSFHKGAKPAADMQRQLDAIGKALGARITIERTTGTGAQLIRTNRDIDVVERRQLEVALMKHPSVRAVEPNGRLYRAFEPNDPMFAQQWHYKGGGMGINATEAWDTADGSGYIVAVLDTGELEHEDLTGQFVAGYDFISDPANARDGDGRDADPTDTGDWDDKYDSSWHGTHVAGTVAALTNNSLGVAGVAHGAKVQHVRVLGNAGGSFADINDAIVWASGGTVPGVPANATPAHIINLSLGGSTVCPTAMQDAIDLAIANGTTVIAAAGNSSSDVANFSPAGCDGVIAVAGTGPNNTKYASTNYGSGISVAAPAGSGVMPATNQVLSTLNTGLEGPEDDSYAWYAGTSMAAPHVAGTAALMMEAAGEHLPPDEVETMLRNTGYDANGLVTGCSTASLWCASLIDAGRAVAVADGTEELPDDPPEPPPPPPPVELENGVTVNAGPMGAGEDRFYTLEVPEDMGSLVFTMAPGTGDSDLYVRFGAAPTDALYDCRPYTGGAVAETCTIDNPEAGTWHVRVDAYSASDNWTLTGTYDEDGPPPPPPPPPTGELENGVTVSGLSVGTGEQLLYFIDVPEGATDLNVQLAGAAGGDADLYVRRNEVPTNTLYDCRSWNTGNNENCAFPTPQAGQWYVRVHGYAAASGLSLTASYVGGPGGGVAPDDLTARYVFVLRGQRVRVPLTWSGGEGEQVDVVFNGEVAATVANNGELMHTFNAGAVGPGSATYQVCNAGTDECSAEITVNYTARR
ncbi:S8 family serine peptidase [Luteimonas sp. MC1895]|uniref:S8 family serine peptidase n=1 Tax=Luteimonas sp. MC1895 TaxID=2819513 RepID=UPI0018F0D64A|nr:S8 family serine peptidase [Luteimonas sp. MC1895]